MRSHDLVRSTATSTCCTRPRGDTSDYDRGVRDGITAVLVLFLMLAAMGYCGGIEQGIIGLPW